jgi:hypothetical protein
MSDHDKNNAKLSASTVGVLEDDAAEAERLTREFHEESAQEALEYASEIPDEEEPFAPTEEDYERDIEFGRLEAARDDHFALLEKTDKQPPKYPLFEYLVDGLLPVNEVHVIAGETGAGKSTWLFENLINPWQHEKAVLGRRSRWLPYVIFVNDRTKAGMVRMLHRLRLNPKQFPIVSTITGESVSLVDKIQRYHDANPELKVVFIEGLHVAQKEGNDYGQSSEVMQRLNGLCQNRDLTIIATTHVSKDNAKHGGGDRTAIIGSSATPGMCETVFVLTKQNGGRVRLTVHPRNERSFTRLYKWTEEGKLLETEDAADEDRFIQYMNQVPMPIFKTADANAYYEKKFKVGADTVRTEINRALQKGWIERLTNENGKVKKGHYKKIELGWKFEDDDEE